jgi:NTP pyrophosphatase (non-canonical NTP hydrolase)
MGDHFNGLRPDEAERLAFLLEELGEAQHAIGKVLRHGYASTNPNEINFPSNRERLEDELGDILAAIRLLVDAGDLRERWIDGARDLKLKSVARWMHHQAAAGGGGTT